MVNLPGIMLVDVKTNFFALTKLDFQLNCDYINPNTHLAVNPNILHNYVLCFAEKSSILLSVRKVMVVQYSYLQK